MSKGKFALGAIFGAVVGTIAGVLAAPKSGKETRAELKVKTDDIKADVTKKAEAVATQAGDMVADAKVKATGVVEDVKSEASDLKGRTERAVAGAKKGFYSKK